MIQISLRVSSSVFSGATQICAKAQRKFGLKN